MRLKLSTAALAACAATALTAGAASANVAFYPYGVGAPTLPLITNFSTDTVGSAPAHAPVGWSWSGGGVVRNNSSLTGVDPAVGPPPGHKANGVNYLDVVSGKSETLTTSAKIDDISIYDGSVDPTDTFTFSFSGAPSVTYTGKMLASLTGASDNGNQWNGSSNGIFNFLFTAPVKSITFSTTKNSLEIASIYAGFAGVPEPAEWLMLILGVAMVGAVARRRRYFAVAA